MSRTDVRGLRGPDARAGVRVVHAGNVWTIWSHGAKPGMRWLVRVLDGRSVTTEAHVSELRSVR